MRATVIGPYPRIVSESTEEDRLRTEVNRVYGGKGDPGLVYRLQQELTLAVVREMREAGIDLPNYGFVDVHDEVTWPLENAEGVEFGGMRKIFHTNTHYRQAVVTGELRRKGPLVGDLARAAQALPGGVKLEFPGPYTLAKHSVMGEGSPYHDEQELAQAYAQFLNEGLGSIQEDEFPLIQFNEPSLTACGRGRPDASMVQAVYRTLVRGLRPPVMVWTFYGTCTPEMVDMLLSLPVRGIGLDMVWDLGVSGYLAGTDGKLIGLGLIDSGDQGSLRLEGAEKVLRKLDRLEHWGIDLENAILSPNATLEHLPKDVARQKLKLIGEVKRRVSA